MAIVQRTITYNKVIDDMYVANYENKSQRIESLIILGGQFELSKKEPPQKRILELLEEIKQKDKKIDELQIELTKKETELDICKGKESEEAEKKRHEAEKELELWDKEVKPNAD